jgi:hypothetical protein
VSEDITECMDAVKWGGTYVMMQFISFHFNGCGVVQVVAHLGSGLGGLLLLLCHLFVHLDDDSRAALRYPSRVCQGQESRSLLTRGGGAFAPCAAKLKNAPLQHLLAVGSDVCGDARGGVVGVSSMQREMACVCATVDARLPWSTSEPALPACSRTPAPPTLSACRSTG